MRNNQIHSQVPICQIKAGDTVIHEGHLTTVGKNHIGYDNFMRHTLFGSSFKLGKELITKVTFKVPTKDGFRYV